MYTLDKEQVKPILIDELGYSSFEAERFASQYPPIHDEFAEAVQRWLEDRTVQDVGVAGTTIRQVMERRGYNFLTAVRALNRLLDDDVTPERRAKRAEDLRHPLWRA